MIEFEKAIAIIKGLDLPMKTEKVDLLNSLNRVLANDVISDTDMPLFNKAAMDGYACKMSDLDNDLIIVDEIPAGKFPDKVLGKGECARIMTGAPLPQGADCVLMKEHVEIKGPETIKRIKSSVGANICYAGEDIKRGDIVIHKGMRIMPAHISILAAAGCMEPEVYNLPEVAVLSTGTELIHPSLKPEKAKIRNTNSFQISAQLLQHGIPALDLGIVHDHKEILKDKIIKGLEEFDLIIVSGGVSVGDYDYIPQIINELHLDILFSGLRIKPGRHMILAQRHNHFIAAVPGNPVSAFVLTEIILKPLLNRLTGMQELTTRILLQLENDYLTNTSELWRFIPIRLTGSGLVEPVEYHGSAHIHSYTMADGIMEIPAGSGKISKGEMVYVRPL